MSLVSYAQNFEDVMLWRALKHIQKGFYVDVGAQHPVVDSVSKAFYEHGWRGIHIEPVPQYAELLRKDRPDETVLQVALADIEGTLELNVIPDTGLSTGDDAYAQLHQLAGNHEHHRIQVPVLTLKSALRSLGDKEVHWLKIDVEGFEEKVLKGWDSQTVRPWVIVVEATVPGSPETNYASWDPIITSANYQFVYFDGLNRFYVSAEHAELAGAFSCPPNVFDGVRLSGLASSEFCRGLITSHQASEKQLVAHIEKLTTDLRAANEQNASGRERESQLQARAQWLQNEWDAAKALADQVGQELESVYASKSWRITWPLRKTMFGIRMAVELSKDAVGRVIGLPNNINKSPVTDSAPPTIQALESQSATKNVIVPEYPLDLREKSINVLSPRAARIYADLKRNVEANKS